MRCERDVASMQEVALLAFVDEAKETKRQFIDW
jgi:hypothetical protein